MLYRNTVQHCTNVLPCSNKLVCTATAVTWPVVTITKPLNSINSKKKWKWNVRRTVFFSFKHSAPGLSDWRRMKNIIIWLIYHIYFRFQFCPWECCCSAQLSNSILFRWVLWVGWPEEGRHHTATCSGVLPLGTRHWHQPQVTICSNLKHKGQ